MGSPPLFLKSQREVAGLFDVDLNTVKNWLAKGMPGEPRKYPVVDMVHWYKQQCEKRLSESRRKLDKEESPRAVTQDDLLLGPLRGDRMMNDEIAGRLVSISVMKPPRFEAMSKIGEAGRTLELQYGSGAADILEEAVVASMEILDTVFES